MPRKPHWDWLSVKNGNAFLIHVMSQPWNEKGGQQRESENHFRKWNKFTRMGRNIEPVVIPRVSVRASPRSSQTAPRQFYESSRSEDGDDNRNHPHARVSVRVSSDKWSSQIAL